MYRVIFSDDAIKDLAKLQKKSPTAIKKLTALLKELEEHPETGTGQIELLKHCSIETWSRRINKEHRLVYRIQEGEKDEENTVLILSVYGHYD
jgi:toxin-antitoxin system, toxin component, Txe/YoeB family